MDDGKKRKFAKTMRRLIEESRTTEGAPVSGNVGEECIGYITDPAGRLYRLNKYTKTDIDIGPGMYNIGDSSFGKKVGITIGSIPNEKKVQTTPGFYNTEQKNTKIYHKLPTKDTKQNPFQRKYQRMDYSIPVSREEKERKTEPQRWHPGVRTAVSRNSAQFASKEQRDPFDLKHVEVPKTTETPKVDKYLYNLYEDESRDTRTASFKSKTDRVCFDIKPSETPDPTKYTLSDTIGRCGGLSFKETFPEGEHVEKEMFPAPGQYEVEPQVVKFNKPKPKDFTLSYPRNMKVPEPISPGPCEFQKYENPLKNSRPVTIFNRNVTAKDRWIPSNTVPGPGQYNIRETLPPPKTVEARKRPLSVFN